MAQRRGQPDLAAAECRVYFQRVIQGIGSTKAQKHAERLSLVLRVLLAGSLSLAFRMKHAAITDITVLGPRRGYLTFVEVKARNGATGIGATDAPRAVLEPLIEHGAPSLRSLLVGEEPRDPARLWRKMFVQWQARRGRGAEGGIAVNAMAALDMAVWDLAGKLAGKPVCQLLGGAVQPRVPAYASATLFTVAADGAWRKKTIPQLVAECRWALAQGFRAVKFGWGRSFAPADLRRLRAIRAALGPETRLMLDFGCPAYWSAGWNAAAAARAARRLVPFDLYFWEEPLPPTDVAGFYRLKRAARVPLASGESLTTTAQFAPFIAARALDLVQPDAQQMGLTQFIEVGRLAARAGLRVAPHGPWTALTVAAHVQLLATMAHGAMIEYPCLKSLGWNSRARREVGLNNFEIVAHPPVLRAGYVELPLRPGLGVGGFIPAALRELERLYR
jgi:L-alanine-DL-glutamate epimerase-like enolase superfamily enzyme